ncbi:MAG TPA: ATP-binding protein [Candidatus Saccharimonadales bacterium]|nr:ATP-binding protein [Candidatus Saccharimonadales bacterium]
MRAGQTEKDIFGVIMWYVVALIISVTGGLAIFAARQHTEDVRTMLAERSVTVASALDSRDIQELQGTSADGDTVIYKELKAKLANIKASNSNARGLYLTGERNGRLFFYVDSEQPNSDYYSPPGEYYDDATNEFKNIFKNGEPVVEGPVKDDFGTFISGLAPIYDDSGRKVIAVLGIDVDASKYYRGIIFATMSPILSGLSLLLLIAFFEWTRRKSRQLLTLRSELVSVASHELRTPITGIRWAAESLQHTVTDPRAAPMIRAIYNSAVSLQASTDDILELTHAMKQQKAVMAPIDLTSLVQEIVNPQILAASQKGVDLIIDESWPKQLVVVCDAGKLKRALNNVISNAIKYTRDNTTVTIKYTGSEHEHHIQVADEGIGIPEAEQDKVFGGFYRASNAVASRIPGTGLGLYLVKIVIEQQGGRVNFISNENKGTVFTISLPRRTIK